MKKVDQANKAIKVYPSNTIGIPDMGAVSYSGSATSTSANKLVDSAANFTEDMVGYIVYNETDNTMAKVTAVDSSTQLTISADIMANTESYFMSRKQTSGCAIYVGVAGDLAVELAGRPNSRVLFKAAPVGYHPISVTRVYSSSTTATDILALFGE